jgi:integrase
VLRWREDVIENGTPRRVYRSEVIGIKSDYPTRRLAMRAAADRLSTVNSPNFRARPTATFRQFAARWQSTVLPQHKPSTQATIRSHLKKYLTPFLGNRCLKDIHVELIQSFIAGLKTAPKTVRNIYVTFQIMWKSAQAWQYVSHDTVSDVVLPQPRRAERFSLSLEEIQRILAAAEEPYRTLYWLAAETALRAGELCGLRIDDLDLERCLLRVEQSSWRGKMQQPKTENAVRSIAISPEMVFHLRDFLLRWRPNSRRLLFATRNSLGREPAREKKTPTAFEKTGDSALRTLRIPARERDFDGQTRCAAEGQAGTVRSQ